MRGKEDRVLIGGEMIGWRRATKELKKFWFKRYLPAYWLVAGRSMELADDLVGAIVQGQLQVRKVVHGWEVPYLDLQRLAVSLSAEDFDQYVTLAKREGLILKPYDWNLVRQYAIKDHGKRVRKALKKLGR